MAEAPCPECGGRYGNHDKECLTRELERIERLSRVLRETIAAGSPHPFTERAREMARTCRAAATKIESTLLLDAFISRGLSVEGRGDDEED